MNLVLTLVLMSSLLACLYPSVDSKTDASMNSKPQSHSGSKASSLKTTKPSQSHKYTEMRTVKPNTAQLEKELKVSMKTFVDLLNSVDNKDALNIATKLASASNDISNIVRQLANDSTRPTENKATD